MSFNQSNNDICSHVVVKLISVAVKNISVTGKHISVAIKHIFLHNNSFFPSKKIYMHFLICIKIDKSAFIYAL